MSNPNVIVIPADPRPKKRIAKISGGVATDIVLQLATYTPDGVTEVEATADARPGDAYAGGVFTRRPPAPPAEVRRLDLVRALRRAGKWGQTKVVVATLPPDDQDDWNAASVIPRDDPVLEQIRAGLAITAAELDAIFYDARGR